MESSIRGKLYDATWDRLRDAAQEHLDDKLSLEDLRGLAKDALDNQRQLEREILEKRGLVRDPTEDVSRYDLGSSEPKDFEPILRTKLPEREKRRADVLLKIGMRLAAERLDVKRFREERLGGQRVLHDEAESFISLTWPEEIRDWDLADLARRLERDYGWRPIDAAWFVLNGAPPRLHPLITRISMHRGKDSPSYCNITLQVVPWVPPKEVEKAFMQARDGVRGGSGPGTVGARKLEVLRFVEEEYAKRERRPTFEELLHAWNREHPRWPYADYRALSKAYREAYQEVFHPSYRMQNAQATRPDTDAS